MSVIAILVIAATVLVIIVLGVAYFACTAHRREDRNLRRARHSLEHMSQDDVSDRWKFYDRW